MKPDLCANAKGFSSHLVNCSTASRISSGSVLLSSYKCCTFGSVQWCATILAQRFETGAANPFPTHAKSERLENRHDKNEEVYLKNRYCDAPALNRLWKLVFETSLRVVCRRRGDMAIASVGGCPTLGSVFIVWFFDSLYFS